MNKSRRALVLAPALAYFCACCLGREGVRSDTEVRGILTEVTKLTPQVEDLLDRMVVLLRLGLANWKSGDSTSAKLNFDEAVKLIDDFPPQEQFADFYRQSIAEARMEVGDVEGADRTLAQIKDDSQRSAGFWTVGLLQARRGDFKGAILKATAIQAENRDEFLESISKMQQEPDSVPSPQDTEESSGTDDSCGDIAAADTINVPEDKATCLAYWGGQLATEGQFSTALEILRRAHKESGLMMDLSLRGYTLEDVARGQARAGSMKEATRTLTEAEPIALTVYREISQHGSTQIIQNLVELKVEWGEFDGANSTLSQVEHKEKLNELQSVARALVKNGHEKEALAWATTQILPSDRALALIGIADALITGMQSVETRQ
ncbi:MAG: hypothetical protein DMG54_01165 [Acidobacteria bacterium]|nr:MAG: hypothetical protein DMG54_01165 [Acidobacteriota bacterium]